MTDHPETDAIVRDASARLAELRAVRAVLEPDKDDPMVMSEITVVESQIAHAEKALGR